MSGSKASNVAIFTGADPVLLDCRLHAGLEAGVSVVDLGSKGWLVRTEIWDNAHGGVWVVEGTPSLVGCTLRDHGSAGIFVAPSSAGKVLVAPDCVFARNAGGDVLGVPSWKPRPARRA